MANGRADDYCSKKGIHLMRRGGDKYITTNSCASASEEAHGKIGLGGEQSEYHPVDESHRTGAGIRTALFMLRVLAENGMAAALRAHGLIGKFTQLIACAMWIAS
jgi:phosphomannomutase